MATTKLAPPPSEPRGRRKPDLLWRLLPVALFLPLVVVLFAGLGVDPSKVPSPLIGKQAPYFSLTDLHDSANTVTPADLRGQVWLFNVWASWCVSCIVEHPFLSDIEGVTLIGLNYKDESAEAILWLEQRGDPYTFSLIDHTGLAGLDWGVYGVPETFVIDAQGVIRYKHIGPLDPQAIEETIMPLVRELQAPTS